MTRQQAKNRLKKLGFDCNVSDLTVGAVFGLTQAEPYYKGTGHFNPIHRDVYVSGYNRRHGGFFYITSHIKGELRPYRGRKTRIIEIGNIFASGKNLQEAIEKFEHNFLNKIYNVEKN